ncbi:hypothetical protein C8R45DRAFT_935946 [Mycena sanguinolenta]|nr:hypothetical protein C8R45DRAFT_935946 [Mycena sanguinolenta]
MNIGTTAAKESKIRRDTVTIVLAEGALPWKLVSNGASVQQINDIESTDASAYAPAQGTTRYSLMLRHWFGLAYVLRAVVDITIAGGLHTVRDRRLGAMKASGLLSATHSGVETRPRVTETANGCIARTVAASQRRTNRGGLVWRDGGEQGGKLHRIVVQASKGLVNLYLPCCAHVIDHVPDPPLGVCGKGTAGPATTALRERTAAQRAPELPKSRARRLGQGYSAKTVRAY